MSNRDQIRTELAEIAKELADLPEDARARRAELRDRQIDLRAAVSEEPDGLTRAELEAMEAELEQLIEKAVEQRVPAASIGGGGETGGGAIHPYEGLELNRQIDEASGYDALRTQLSAVRRRLEALDTSDTGADETGAAPVVPLT